MRREFNRINFPGAYECDNCPGNAAPARGRACPSWWTIQRMNPQTGEEFEEELCGEVVEPEMLVELFKIGNRPTAAVNDLRNHVAELERQVAGLTEMVSQAVSALQWVAVAQARQVVVTMPAPHDVARLDGGPDATAR